MKIPFDDPIAVEVMSAIRGGDVEGLRHLLTETPALTTARILDNRGCERTLLHVAADWPGHFPNGAATVATLVAAGAELNASMNGSLNSHETPLHWAASSDDVAVLDALLDGGADIETPGAIFTGGTAMSDAVVFAQWNAARRLLERGAQTTIWQAAALGLLDRVEELCVVDPPPSNHDITNAFWHACRGGQLGTAEFLLQRGADVNWIGHDQKTPLDAAVESGADDVVQWLQDQ